MKRIALLLVLALGSWPLFSAHAQRMCFAGFRVAAVNIGYVNGDMGPDGGDAVYFRLDNSWTIGTHSTRLQPRLAARAGLVQAADDGDGGGYRIRAYDHYHPFCDDIDQIEIYR
jgi:hypothetical protein